MFALPHPSDWTTVTLAIVLAYLLGSVPFGYLFSLASGAGDVRKIGSGSTGATNVLRTGKVWAAVATLICDAAKGAVAVLAARRFGGDTLAFFAALAALAGHLYPVWLKFMGGKGVATAAGILISVYWPVGLALLATWAAMLAIFRISSLSAIAACVAAPIYMVLFHQPLYATLALVMAVIILLAHGKNIARILNGTEPRVGQKTTA